MRVNYLPVMRITDSKACKTNERDLWVWVRRTDLLASLKTAAQEIRQALALPEVAIRLAPSQKKDESGNGSD